MERYEAIIIDDELKNIELLSHFVNKYCPEIELVGTALTYQSGLDLISEKNPVIVFLDITLDKDTGFELIDELDEEFKVIFITAHREFALKAFKYRAIDYLLKPIDILELQKAVGRAITQIDYENNTDSDESNSLDFLPNGIIAIPTANSVVMVPMDDILYCHSNGKNTVFHLSDQSEVVSNKNIGEYEKKLKGKDFYRIHNRYMVNVTKISKINKSDGFFCELPGNIHLTVSARKQQEFQKYLGLN